MKTERPALAIRLVRMAWEHPKVSVLS